MAAHHGAYARAELIEIEGLDEVVVGASIQPRNLVAGAVARGEHDHGHGILPRTQRAQHVEATAGQGFRVGRGRGGQAEVEQQEVEAFAGQRALRGARIAHPIDRMALEPQRAAQALADHPVVFHQQQSHPKRIPCVTAGAACKQP